MVFPTQERSNAVQIKYIATMAIALESKELVSVPHFSKPCSFLSLNFQ